MSCSITSSIARLVEASLTRLTCRDLTTLPIISTTFSILGWDSVELKGSRMWNGVTSRLWTFLYVYIFFNIKDFTNPRNFRRASTS